jgi:diguanylate cyclase (GGDEF)-like protein/PAS domain S-box-containing protein
MRQARSERAITLESIVDSLPDLMFLMDEEGVYRDVFANGKEDLLFVPPEVLLGKTAYDIFEAEQAEVFTETLRRAIRERVEVTLEYPLDIGDRELVFEARIVPLVSQSSARKKHALVIIREVTRTHEEAQTARLVEKVFQDATEGMIIENKERFVVKVNPAMLEILGMEEKQILGRHSDFFKPMFQAETVRDLYDSMETLGFWHGEAELKLPSGKHKLTWVSINAVLDDEGVVSNYLVMVTDISEVRKSREQLEFMANHDILTGLPNRVLLFEHLEHAIASIKRAQSMGALLFMDIDNFKEINDNFGHRIGDLLLIEVAQRLKDAVRSSDTVGRLGGDEFLLIAENVHHIDEVLIIIQKIRKLFSMPLVLKDVELEVTLSIGIALIPEDGEDVEVLVSAADQAMYVVKERGRNGFEFYSRHYSLLSHEYFRIQRGIRQAIREKAFEMVYQPQFSISDGRICGAEALLRCTHEALQDIPVEKLIAIAEESEAIHEIGRFVFRSVCAQIEKWRTLSVMPVRIAINLSRRELASKTLVESVHENLSRCCVTPPELEFEITESTLMQGGGSARQNIEALRKMGCLFSIDDFGTGYSSLSNLKLFNLDKLKIDKMFIDTLVSDEDDQVIVSATISMAKKLGLTVLAEGVEHDAQLALLQQYGCDEVQGFFFSEPVSEEKMTQLLQENEAVFIP